MRFLAAASATLLSAVSLAAPVEVASAASGSGIYYTNQAFWICPTPGLDCYRDIVRPRMCVDLKGTPFDNNISSFGPDPGVQCTVYDGYSCTGNHENIFYMGYAWMGWNGWDNRISSYACDYCTPGKKGCNAA